jgi:hypothetical protein
MNRRQRLPAGNLADVPTHVVRMMLFEHLKKKSAPFATFAGQLCVFVDQISSGAPHAARGPIDTRIFNSTSLSRWQRTPSIILV